MKHHTVLNKIIVSFGLVFLMVSIFTPQAFAYPPASSDYKFYINEKEVGTVGLEIEVNSVVMIKITTDLTCSKIEFNLTRSGLSFPIDEFLKEDDGLFYYELDTTSYQGIRLPEGSYGMKFLFFDPAYPGAENLMIYIIIAVVAVVAVVAFIIIKKKRDAQLIAQASSSSNEPERKRKIYSGASSIGKADGQRADATMEKRKQSPGTPTEIARPRSSPIRSSSPEIKVPSSADMDKLPASVQIKLEEQKVAVDQRVKFLNSKVDVLRSQLDMMTMIVSVVEDQPSCPICNKVLAKNWDFCPYCKLEEQKDELNMKKSVATIDKNKTSKCSKCGYILDPSWITCPKCFAKDKNL
jgi:hypothetical protein